MQNFKNIIGTGFPDYINKQIKKRESIISQSTRNNSSLNYLNNRNAWVRLSSSVNVNNSAELAQLNVLQGGTVIAGGNKTRIKKGFNETYSKGNLDDLGFKPMPGITNVSIGTGGKWQTLMQADIEFTCYDLGQLDTMTKLYMSLGYNVFLEWGHSNYFKSDNNRLETNPSTVPFFSLKKEEESLKDKILKDATTKRLNTEGNYECILGTVYNFGWTANNDGSYNCKIQVMGPGGIVESLKINNSSGVDFKIYNNEEDDATNYGSDLGNALSTIRDFFLGLGKIISQTGGFNSSQVFNQGLATISLDDELKENNMPEGLTYRRLLNTIFKAAQYPGPRFVGDTIESDFPNVKNGNAHQLISGYSDQVTALSSNLYLGYISSTTIDSQKRFSTYITLGHLFTLIQHLGIFKTGKSTSRPIIYLDYNPGNTIIKSAKNQASVDPSTCLIPYDLDQLFADNDINVTELKDEISSKKGSERASDTLLGNPFTKEGRISRISVSQKSKEIPSFNGKLFNILINLDFAIDTLKSLSRGPNKEVSLMDYITSILDNINVSIGKINSFRPFFDKDSDCIRIIDENQIIDESKDNEVIEIKNFGTNSIVTDYSFTSAITPTIASQIIIAAQNSDSDLEEFPEDIFSFQSLSKNLTDRLAVTKTPPILKNTKVEKVTVATEEKNKNNAYKKLYTHFYNVYEFEKNISKETINELTNVYTDLLNRKENSIIISNKKLPPTRPIPVEYTVTIDGISGILPYSIFRIPDDRLPTQYRQNKNINMSGIDFTIFSINHSIENNKWYTTLRGQILYRNNKI